jgi:hypothetical protein
MLTAILLIAAYTAVVVTIQALRKPTNKPVTIVEPVRNPCGAVYMDAKHEGKIKSELEIDE